MHRFLLAVAVVSGAAAISVSAQQPVATAAAAAVQRVAPAVLPGTAKSAFAVIQGNVANVANATGGRLAGVVRLRDVHFGGVVDTQVPDPTGAFTFQSLDPGNYVVEFVAKDESVLGTSQILTVNAGETATATLPLPGLALSLVGRVAQAVPGVMAVLAAAAASGVLAESIEATGAQDISPR
jgi:hypothetical protein